MNILGILCRYNISDSVVVGSDVLEDRLRVAGWEKAAPNRRAPADALRRSLKDLSTQFTHIEHTQTGDEWRVSGHYEKPPAPGGPRQVQQMLFRVTLRGDRLRIPTPNLPEGYFEQAKTLVRWLSQRYNWYTNYCDADAVRRSVYACMEVMRFPHVNPGEYFIPVKQRHIIEELRAVFGPDNFDRGSVRFSERELYDSPTNRASLGGDILHNIEDFLEKVRNAVLRHDLGEDTPHPETLRDWLRRLNHTQSVFTYFNRHVFDGALTAPSDLDELIERIGEIRAAKLGEATHREDPHESRVA